jgi:hypothetical protein
LNKRFLAGAEGEGFEPSRGLTTDNGFRDRTNYAICRAFVRRAPVCAPASSRRRAKLADGSTALADAPTVSFGEENLYGQLGGRHDESLRSESRPLGVEPASAARLSP